MIKDFQKKIGATPDGIFGKETITKGAEFLDITPTQAVHFFAQVAHESGMFKYSEENLNYSEMALLRVFGKYFDKVSAKQYARQPEKIANRVYANRMGNGDEKSGDGWRYRGRGAIQLTGSNNYMSFAKWLGKDIKPSEVSTEYCFESAKWFFDENSLWKYCNEISDKNIEKLSRRINGGYHGLRERNDLTYKYAKYV